MKRQCIRLLAAMALLLPGAWAQAAITCTVSSPGFATSYDPAAVTQTIVQTSLTVSCQRNLAGDATSLSYEVSAGNGLYATGNQNNARLAANDVKYDVYRDSACGSEWRGNATLPVGGGSMTLSGLLPTSVDIPYWGCIPALQATATAGIHTDTVNMTLDVAWGAGAANRASFAGTFNAALHVSSTCNITTAPGTITFNYTSFGPAINPTTTFGATCTSSLPYTMALDVTTGTLLGLNYSLALSAAGGTGNGFEQPYTITGTMAAGQAGTCAAATCSASQPHTLTITY